MRAKITSFCLLIIILISMGTGCQFSLKPAPIAQKGILDLRDWDFAKDGTAELNGEWEYIDLLTQENQAEFAEVPHSWKQPITGSRSYALTVILPEKVKRLGIYTESQGSAYRLDIDDETILTNGRVGSTEREMIPEKLPQSSVFFAEDQTIVIDIAISNFHHRKGGFRNPLIIGSEKSIFRLHRNKRYTQIFTFSIYVILGIYHTVFFLIRKKNKEALFFAIVCYVIAIRVGLTNQKVLLDILTFIPWTISIKIEYLTFYSALPVFSLYLSSLYPDYIKPWINRLFFSAAAAYSLIAMLWDTMFASQTIPSYQIIILCQLAFMTYTLARLILDKKEGAILIASVSFILIVSGVIDILYFREILPYGDILSFSFLFYMFTQAVILSSRFARAFTKVEDLSEELERANKSLVQSEAKYRSLFEQSGDMIILTDKHLNITGINPSVNRILGYGEEEILGQKVNKLISHREVWISFTRVIRNAVTVRNLELKLQTASGKEIFVLLSAERRYDSEGNLSGYYGSLKDITDRKMAEIEKIRSLELERIAFTDPLTGLYNRRFFNEVAEKELRRARRKGTNHTLCLIDVDYFKSINDTYGHSTGDAVLVNLSRYLRESIRSIDVLSRYGGEEFVMLLTDVDDAKAVDLLEQMRRNIEKEILGEAEGENISITISSGIVHFDYEHPETFETLLEKADRALYQSKEKGRNRITVWSDKQ